MAVFAVLQSVIGGGLPVHDAPTRPPFNEAGQQRKHPKMRIVAEGRAPFEVPYAPRETQSDGFVPQFTVVDRPGREPLLIRTGGALQSMSFELVLGHLNPNQSVEKPLKQLRALAGSGKRMRIKFDDLMAGKRWRLTGFTEHVTMRQHGTNQPTRAVCSFVFTEASDPVVAVGPVSGGHQGGGKDDKKWPKFYVVKKGDTLQAIARKFYGGTEGWKDIADANKIRKPKALKVGEKLRIPAPKGRKHGPPLGEPTTGPR